MAKKARGMGLCWARCVARLVRRENAKQTHKPKTNKSLFTNS